MRTDELAYKFFHEHAGYSYNPATQTQDQGRAECAKQLADAEKWAAAAGISFRWEYDPETNSSDFSDDPDPWVLWECYMHNSDGEIISYIGAVDFGRGGCPWNSPYRRVVEAELAYGAMPDMETGEVFV